MARLPPIVVPGYPRDVTRRDLRSMDVFHLEVDRRELTGRDLGEGRPGRPRKRPLQKQYYVPRIPRKVRPRLLGNLYTQWEVNYYIGNKVIHSVRFLRGRS